MEWGHLYVTDPRDMAGCTKVRPHTDPKTKSSVQMAYWKPITITGVSSIVQNTNAHAAREWSEPAASEPIYAAMKERGR